VEMKIELMIMMMMIFSLSPFQGSYILSKALDNVYSRYVSRCLISYSI